jgi:oligopeptide transport system substrate-binding protein
LISFIGCARPEQRADIIIINGPEPQSLDPALATIQPDMRIVRCLFEGLTRLDPVRGVPEPGLAERWDVSEDRTVYTFYLRTNAVWSTGQKITAEDVVYSWLRVLKPELGSDYTRQLYFIRGAEALSVGKLKDPSELGLRALDPHTLRVELVNPTPFFLDLCASTTFAVVPRFHIEKYGDWWLRRPPVPTSGTYTLEAWRMQDRIRLRKNPLHWDAANIRNNVTDLLPVDYANTAINLYETKQADIIWDKGLVPSELMDVMKNRPDCHFFDYLGTYFYRYNVTRKPFADWRVRHALALVVDRQRLVERITRSGERPASHFTPATVANYTPPEGLGYDLSRARQLLAEAGYPEGKGFPSFQYLTKTSKLDEQIAVELQAMWRKELGIRMELRQTESQVYYSAQSALDYDMSRSSWVGDYNDANTFLDVFMSDNGNNRTGWKNARYDELIREANRQPDAARRAAMLQEAEKMLVQRDLPIVPLFFYAGINFFDTNRIGGIYFNLIDEHPVYAIWKKKSNQ